MNLRFGVCDQTPCGTSGGISAVPCVSWTSIPVSPGRNPLALGIGANVAIFTLINALPLGDLLVPHPERLVELSGVRHGDLERVHSPFFTLLRLPSTSLARMLPATRAANLPPGLRVPDATATGFQPSRRGYVLDRVSPA